MTATGELRESPIRRMPLTARCLRQKTSGTGSLPDSFSFITADRPNIIITTVKEACDSEEIIIRVYEAYGKRTRVGFTLGVDAGGICEVDMMERKVVAEKKNVGRGFQEEFKPYEIKTYRVALSG